KARRQTQEVETLDEHAINEPALSAIECFGKALERDDTDLNLWRKTARLGTALKSWRTARFCLESIIDGDDELQDEVAERMGLERALAIRGLQQILNSTEDDVYASIQQLKKPRKALLRLLEHQADPLPFLSCPSFPRLAEKPGQSSVGYTHLLPDKITWTALGQAILSCLRLSRDGQVKAVRGSVRITFPEPIDLLCSDLPASLKLAANANDSPSNQPEAETGSKMGAEFEKATSGGNLPVLGSATKGNEASPSDSGEQQTRQNESEARKSGESRKRSSIAAGNEEPGGNGRAKSKRLRARENITELAETEHSVFDQAQAQEEWMLDYYHADVNFFRVVDVFLKQLGFGSMERPEELRKIWKEYSQSDPSDDSLSPQEKLEATLFKTLRSALYGWDDKKAKLSLDSLGNSNSKNPDEAKRTAMSMLLAQFAKDQKRPDSDPLSETLGLTEFVQKINDQDLDIETVAYRWVTALLDGGLLSCDIGVEDKSSYATKLWSPEMKQVVLSLIAESDYIFYSELNEFSSRIDGFVSGFENELSPDELKSQLQSAITISQTIFELYLESYSTLLKSDAEAGPSSAPLQHSLTERWCRLSRYFINLYTVLPDAQPPTTVALRHLWAFTLYLNLPHQTESEYIMRSLCELERVLVSEGRPVINLPNNAAMPEISVQIIEQEKSRLMSIDFFTNLFRPDNSDPVQVIENLAPLLEPESIKFVNNDETMEMQTSLQSSRRWRLSLIQEMRPFVYTCGRSSGKPTMQ
ncbi:Histone transcription regulator 3, partial [Ascosphaera atra]